MSLRQDFLLFKLILTVARLCFGLRLSLATPFTDETLKYVQI